MLARRKYSASKHSAKLYYCKHCNEHLCHKTYRRHARLFLSQKKASITVDLQSLTSDHDVTVEQGM